MALNDWYFDDSVPHDVHRCCKGHIFKAALTDRKKICPICHPPSAIKIFPRAYHSWTGMFQRCDNPKCKSYPRYGGRGIEICDRWYDFANFIEDMGERPPGTSLDRIDNDGNYEPGNCRWATPKEQAQNMSTNINITIGGQTKCLAEWARCANLSALIFQGMLKNGHDFTYLCSQGDSSGSDQDG